MQEQTRAKLQALALALQSELRPGGGDDAAGAGPGAGDDDPPRLRAPWEGAPETPGATAERVRAEVARIEAEMQEAEAVLRDIAAVEDAHRERHGVRLLGEGH